LLRHLSTLLNPNSIDRLQLNGVAGRWNELGVLLRSHVGVIWSPLDSHMTRMPFLRTRVDRGLPTPQAAVYFLGIDPLDSCLDQLNFSLPRKGRR
jgi:hypothetical protein